MLFMASEQMYLIMFAAYGLRVGQMPNRAWMPVKN